MRELQEKKVSFLSGDSKLGISYDLFCGHMGLKMQSTFGK